MALIEALPAIQTDLISLEVQDAFDCLLSHHFPFSIISPNAFQLQVTK